jgi:hypothetical protein
MTSGILCVMVVTFFPGQLSSLLWLDFFGEARLTLFGFLLGGVFGGIGVVIAAAGLLLSGGNNENRLKLFPSVLVLIGVVCLFVFLFYNSLATPSVPQLPPGESIRI